MSQAATAERPLRILHVEDSAADAELVCSALEADGFVCEIVRVEDEPEFQRALDADGFDLVLCDYSLPGFDGLAALAVARARLPDVPFLFVSGTIGEERAVESLKNGATDYILKGHLSRLAAAVRRALSESSERRARRTAEEELAASRRFIERVIQSTPNIVYVYDLKEQRNVFVNQEITTLLGYSAAEVQGMGRVFPGALLHPHDRLRTADQQRRIRAATEGQVLELEFRIRRRSGEWRWLHTRETVFARDPEGRPSRVLGVAEDVTERRKFERHRAAQYALTRVLADSRSWREAAPRVLECLCRHLDFHVGEFWVPAPEKHALLPEVFWHAAEADAQPWAEASAGLRCARGQDLPGRAWESGGVLWFPEVGVHAQFRRSALAARLELRSAFGIPLAGRAGPPAVLAVYARESIDPEPDLVRLLESLGSQLAEFLERKQAEERIREQAALLESAHEAIFVEDLAGRITYWNRGAEQLYGCSAEQALDRRLGDMVQDGALGILALARQRVREQGAWTGVLEQKTLDGRELVVQSHRTLVRDDSGAPRSVLIINTDVTEARRLEAKFLRAQRMESIGALAGGIAHDLNNVLSPIVMAVDLLRRKISDPAGQRMLTALETSAQRGADLVKQVLTFARGGHGERIVLQPAHLVREMEKITRETFPKSVQVRVRIERALWNVMGEATPLHQVLLNLCVNARDAMPEGGVLTLTAENLNLDEAASRRHPEAQPGPYVVLTVSDTGTGIPKEVMGRIFDPFFTTKAIGSGTGLGLSTTLSIVKGHGGFLDVYSEEGGGTTFQVYLPALLDGGTLASGADEESLPVGAGQLILVVDDEASVREIAREILESHGYRVVIANDGREALEQFSRNRPEIAAVVTDLSMPNLDGPAEIRALREADPGLRIIAASGLASGHRIDEVEEMGVNAFLTKPYSARKLLGVLRSVLG